MFLYLKKEIKLSLSIPWTHGGCKEKDVDIVDRLIMN